MKTLSWTIGFAVLAMCLGLGSGCNPPPQLVTVPNVVGQTQAMAGSMLAVAQLATGTVTQQCDNTVAAGLVISQSPAAATPVIPNSPVNLVISTGPCPVNVPNVVGQTQAGAGAALTAAGLTVGTVTQQCDNTVAAGLVISQNPLAGSPAPPGSPVDFVTSTGPCPVNVPNVVGLTQTAAGTNITGANLTVGTVTQQCDNTVAAGLVISQNPLAGSPAPPGSPVDFVISTGPCPVNVPNVVGQTQSAAATAITGAILVVGTVTQQCDNTVAAGSVISQNPAAGSPVPPSTPVDLVISTGPCPVNVPNVVGQTQAAAATAITGANLVVGTVTQQCDNTVAAGSVISQNPAAGSPVPPSTPVDLVISTGPCPVNVPNVVGQALTGGTPLPVAGATLAAAGLTVGTITNKCSPVDASGLPLFPAGVVMAQSPPAGTPVPPGTPVDLIVSSGPC
jgi:beta-lactam-binding protein with PASTA domain